MNLNYSIRGRHETDVAGARRSRGILGAVVLVAVLGSNPAVAAPPAPCDMRLTVELTPDVPNPRDVGFLSSLLSNYANYRLTLWQQRSDTVIVLELTGPGPDYRCQDVVDTMRKDGRVLSVHVHDESS
jgi:hypothetical protein